MTKWMTMREFLRGGYRTLDDTTIISNHGRPVFTVHPHNGSNGSAPERIKSEWATKPIEDLVHDIAEDYRERPVSAVPKKATARGRTGRT